MSATLEEFLMAAEYLMVNGCDKVILCERGIRTFTKHTRNTLDIGIIPALKQKSHLPVIVDPSHSSGENYSVIPHALAGLTVGAHGVIVDVHDKPNEALCDGPQALTPTQFTKLAHLADDAMNLANKMDNA
jgi:3-deoxy-7-phosphoheptulonate synthase